MSRHMVLLALWAVAGSCSAQKAAIPAGGGHVQGGLFGGGGSSWAPWLAPSVTRGVLGQTGADAPVVFSAVWAGSGSAEIWATSLDGSVVVRLTDTGMDARHPTWSSDARRVAFRCSCPSQYTDLWAIGSDGTGLTRLTNNSLQEYDPHWSPDDQKIAFGGREGPGDTDVYVVALADRTVTRLTYGPGEMGSPRWSPNGRRILFNRVGDGDGELRLMNADGSDQRLLLGGLRMPAHPDWSPDGQRITFSQLTDTSRELFVMNADGSGLTQLTDNPFADHHVTWSPDGRRLVYQRGSPGRLCSMAPDGTGAERVTDYRLDVSQPAWPPAYWVPRCLGWLVSPGYARDGVEPDVGAAGTLFTFKVRYFQPDGEAPVTARCRIERWEAGAWQGHQLLELGKESGEPTVGAVYSGSAELPAGRYRHRFVFADSRGQLRGLPANPTYGPVTKAELLWVGGLAYSDRGVGPQIGRWDTTFKFRVAYANPIGEAPAWSNCKLQSREGDTWQDYAILPMDLVSGDPSSKGAQYVSSAVLPAGSYRYRFAFGDSEGSVPGVPASYHTGPLVVNAPPRLEWVGKPAFAGGGVAPTRGTDGTTFRFAVLYTDTNGDLPVKRQVSVQHIGDNGDWSKGMRLTLTGGSQSVMTGNVYQTSVALANGVYRYRFEMTDRASPAKGAPTMWQSGPVIKDAPPILTWAPGQPYEPDGVEPDKGAPGRYRFRVNYIDSEGAKPLSAELVLIHPSGEKTRHDLKAGPWGNWQTGRWLCLTLDLQDPGQYKYRFVVGNRDGQATTFRAARGPHTGPTIIGSGADVVVSGLAAVPTAAGAQITFALSAPATVEARVLNIAGRPVRRLCANRQCATGTNTLVWNALSDQGLRIPGGMYLVRVTACSDDGAQSSRLATVSLR